MALTAVTSAPSSQRIAHARDWLHARQPTEEVLIIGPTLGAANEFTRDLAQKKRASFGYHRLTLGQLASALARFMHWPRQVRLAVTRTLRADPDSLVR